MLRTHCRRSLCTTGQIRGVDSGVNGPDFDAVLAEFLTLLDHVHVQRCLAGSVC
jgi:hypothetical protein